MLTVLWCGWRSAFGRTLPDIRAMEVVMSAEQSTPEGDEQTEPRAGW